MRIVNTIRSRKGLNQIVRSHRLPVNKDRRHTRSVKARQQTVYNNYQIKLLAPSFELRRFSGKPFIQIHIIWLNLREIKFCTEHMIVIIQRTLHLQLIHMWSFFILRYRICNGEFRKIRKNLLHLLINHKRGLSVLYTCQ